MGRALGFFVASRSWGQADVALGKHSQKLCGWLTGRYGYYPGDHKAGS
jgi:hypothetical protein